MFRSLASSYTLIFAINPPKSHCYASGLRVPGRWCPDRMGRIAGRLESFQMSFFSGRLHGGGRLNRFNRFVSFGCRLDDLVAGGVYRRCRFIHGGFGLYSLF